MRKICLIEEARHRVKVYVTEVPPVRELLACEYTARYLKSHRLPYHTETRLVQGSWKKEKK